MVLRGPIPSPSARVDPDVVPVLSALDASALGRCDMGHGVVLRAGRSGGGAGLDNSGWLLDLLMHLFVNDQTLRRSLSAIRLGGATQPRFTASCRSQLHEGCAMVQRQFILARTRTKVPVT